jgi:hypothetical protein
MSREDTFWVLFILAMLGLSILVFSVDLTDFRHAVVHRPGSVLKEP